MELLAKQRAEETKAAEADVLVALADATLPVGAWTTRCGWSFGSVSHKRFSEREVTCARCLASKVAQERKLSF